MDYTIRAPVILQFGRAGFEEEPIEAKVEAKNVEEAVEKFKDRAHDMLVETDNCDAVDFYPYREFESRYDIVEE